MAKQQIQTLPYNLEAEQSLLGSMLIDQELQSENGPCGLIREIF